MLSVSLYLGSSNSLFRLSAVSKETVGNSWDLLDAILDHKHQNHPESYLANEANRFAVKVTLIIVCQRVSPQYTIDCFADISTQEDLDQSNIKKAERQIRFFNLFFI